MTALAISDVLLNKYTLIGVITVFLGGIVSIIFFARKGQIGPRAYVRVFNLEIILIFGIIYEVAAILWLTSPIPIHAFKSASPIGSTLFIYHDLSNHSGDLSTVTWSPDGKHIASADGAVEDTTVNIWDAFTGKISSIYTYNPSTDQYGNFEQIGSVAWSPNGKYFVSTGGIFGGATVHIWDTATGNIFAAYPEHEVNGIAWSPDSTRIATSSIRNGGDTVQVRDVASGNIKFTSKASFADISTIAWSPNGQYIAIGEDGDSTKSIKNVEVLNATTGVHIFTYQTFHGNVNALAWSSDSKRVASLYNDGTVQVWGTSAEGKIITHHSLLGPATGYSSFGGLAWSPDGKFIASDKGGNVEVWNANTGKVVFVYNSRSGAGALAWSPDGQYIASVDGVSVDVWQAEERHEQSTAYMQRDNSLKQFLLLFGIPIVIIIDVFIIVKYTNMRQLNYWKATGPTVIVVLIIIIALSQVIGVKWF